jgi:hypothetical protein
MIDFDDFKTVPMGIPNEAMLWDSKPLGDDFQILRNGDLGSDCTLLFKGLAGEKNRSFKLSDIGPEGLALMGEQLCEVALALSVIEDGTTEERNKFWMKSSSIDRRQPN